MAIMKEFKEYAMEKLSIIGNVTIRPMMGEYLLYYMSTLFGGIYNDRMLLKMTESNKRLLKNYQEEIPYKGAKPMLLLDLDSSEDIAGIILETCKELKKNN